MEQIKLIEMIKELKEALEKELSLTSGWGDCACNSFYICTACQSKKVIEKARNLLKEIE